MKRNAYTRAIACITLLAAAVLAACTKDDAMSGGGDNARTPVLFTAVIQPNATATVSPTDNTVAPANNAVIPGLTRDLLPRSATPATRTVPGADATQTRWTTADRIAVFMLTKGGNIPADILPAAHNVPYSIDPTTGKMTQAVPLVYNPADGTTAPGDIVPVYYPSGDDEVDFVAYYPYHPALEADVPNKLTPYIYSINLQDQTTADKQFQADVLYSDNVRGARRSKDPVGLRFRHLHAKLRLDITLTEGLAGGQVTKVTLPSMPWQVEFDMRNGSANPIFPLSNDTISCLPLPSPTTGADATFTALVPPHNGTDFAGRQITVTVDGEDYTGTIPDDHHYAANTMYAYPVRVTPRGLTIAAPTADVPWTDAKPLPQGYDLTIGNEDELRRFAELVNTGGTINGKPAHEAHVLQIADITLTEEWTPIGNSYAHVFRGAYNGNGHTITGLTITTEPPVFIGEGPDLACAGLFSFVQEAVLTGIHLREVQINIQMGSDLIELHAGSIAGVLENSTLSLCSASGTVNVENSGVTSTFVGGIAGATVGSTISRCRAAVETTAFTTHAEGSVWAGGITGWQNWPGFILSCEVQGSVVTAKGNKSTRAGGIAGGNYGDSFIAFCRTGENVVTARGTGELNYAGGLVGDNGGYLYSCYSRATATATGGVKNYAGAIVGLLDSQADVQHCYGTGAPGPGTSDLTADPGLGIVYNTSPSSDAIYGVMRGYTGIVESIIAGVNTAYPYATHYDRAVYPAHSIEPVRVKWGPGIEVWQRGINTTYPEINMKYEGEDNPAAP